MARDIHKSSFDEGTQIKLLILNEYFKEWLPVFLRARKKYWDRIIIYDFFAGEGKDVDGTQGSPLIILSELKNYCQDILKDKILCHLILNEYDKIKVEILRNNVTNKLKHCKNYPSCPKTTNEDCTFQITIEDKDFRSLFMEVYKSMKSNPELPRFMFLDQYGIKQITGDVFRKLVELKRTDFIFFISSSFASRFAEMPEFKKYLKLSREEFDLNKSFHCHRVIFNYYKQLIPVGTEYYLAPFSIKKGTNIYGLIFGTNHSLGIEKFLNICWSINEQTGDANFDIDNERINPMEPSLFEQFDLPNKIQHFQNQLKQKIRSHELSSLKQVYRFTFEMGCLPKHANIVIKELQQERIVKKQLPLQSRNVHKIQNVNLIPNEEYKN